MKLLLITRRIASCMDLKMCKINVEDVEQVSKRLCFEFQSKLFICDPIAFGSFFHVNVHPYSGCSNVRADCRWDYYILMRCQQFEITISNRFGWQSHWRFVMLHKDWMWFGRCVRSKIDLQQVTVNFCFKQAPMNHKLSNGKASTAW